LQVRITLLLAEPFDVLTIAIGVLPQVPQVVQFQLIKRAAAVVVTGGAAVAADNSDSDEPVPVQDQAFISERTVIVGSSCCICCTEGVQDIELAVFPQAEKHAVAIRASGLGVRV
jgi:hypothetical protein